MEDNNPGALILILLFGGLAVWWLLNKKTATPVAPPGAPCAVGVSYQGVGTSIPCSVVGAGIKAVQTDVNYAATGLAAPFNTPNTTSSAYLLRLASDANKSGTVATRPPGGWKPAPKGPPLPPGATNIVTQDSSGVYHLEVVQLSPIPGAPASVISIN